MAQGIHGAANSSAGKQGLPPTGSYNSGGDYNKRIEDEMYERRRQGELRRQIEEKERELE